MNQEDDPADGEIEFDEAVVDAATISVLNRLLPQLRITSKLSDFDMSPKEALHVCAALLNLNFLDSAPPLVAEDMADEISAYEGNDLTLAERASFAARVRRLPASEAFLLFAGTALFQAVRAKYAQAEPREFMRVSS